MAPRRLMGLLARLRSRYPWLDHVVRAQQRYDSSQGDFYAAGISYFTLFAIFPLLMVGFAVVGFVHTFRVVHWTGEEWYRFRKMS